MTRELYDRLNNLSGIVVNAALEVHRTLGPGLLESVYEECLKTELLSRGVNVESQVSLPVIYKGIRTGKEFRLDLLVENELVIELKAVDELKAVHEVQLLTYMKLAGKHMGLLINFNVPVIKYGIKRKISGFVDE